MWEVLRVSGIVLGRADAPGLLLLAHKNDFVTLLCFICRWETLRVNCIVLGRC